MPTKKRSIWPKLFIFLIIFGGGAGVYFWKLKDKDTPIDLKSAKPSRGDIVQAVTANGQILPVRNIQVGSQVSGIIKELLVDFNSRVTNGQVIAKIDPSTYLQNITQAEAEMADAQAALEYAQINEKRARLLTAQKLIPEADFEKAVVDLHQAEARLKVREASLQKARVDLEKTTIYAPVDGMVISRVVDVGQTVAASLNAPTLFQIAHDLRQMRIEAMVSEADVGGVNDDQEVTFTVDAFPNRQFKGRVAQVRFAAITNQNVVNYTAVVEVNNEDLKLRPGMTATASIITAKKEGVLRVPNSALRFKPPQELMSRSATNLPAGGPTMASKDSRGEIGNVERPRSERGEGGREGSSRGEGGPDADERRKRFESMTPEQREEMRARFAAGGGGGGRRREATEGPVTRTVYLIEKNAEGQQTVKPVTIKTGIADGTFTEVIEGLKDSDVVAVGLNLAASTNPGAPAQGKSPFGGSPFGGGMRGPR